MPGWLSRNNFTASDFVHFSDLNNLANDDRNWGGDVNGGGYHLSNVILQGSGGFSSYVSPIEITPGSTGSSCVQLDQTVGANHVARWTVCKDATTETGSNTGSNFAIGRYTDAGAIIDTPISINRSTGLITMGAQQWAGAVNGGGNTLSNVVLSGVTVPGTVPTTRKINTGLGLTGGGDLSADRTIAGVPMAASGAGHAAGLAPDPGATAGTTRYLREDATWTVPPGAGGGTANYWVNGALVGTQPTLNLIAGTNVTVAGVNNTGANRVDVTITSTGTGGTGQPQTPWASDIQAAGFRLLNTGNVGIGNTLAVMPDTLAADIHLVIGGPAVGRIALSNTQASTGALVGSCSFANFSISGTEKRIAMINAWTDGTIDSGALLFYAFGAGGLALERMRITSAGNIGIGTSAPANRIAIVADAQNYAAIAQTTLSITDTDAAAGGANGGRLLRIINRRNSGAISQNLSTTDGVNYNLDATSSYGLWASFNNQNFSISFVPPGTSPQAMTIPILSAIPTGIGIGIGAPAALLTVFGAPNNFIGQVQIASNSNNAGLSMYTGSANAAMRNWQIQTNYSGAGSIDFMVSTSNTTAPVTSVVTLTPVGNVGIGKQNPNTPLDIYGGAANENFHVQGAVNIANSICISSVNDANSGFSPLEIRTSQTNFTTGPVAVGTTSAPSQTNLLVIASPNPATPATATQITVGESTNNAGYRLALGYYYDSSTSLYKGVVQSTHSGAGNALLLNPGGGAVGIGVTAPAWGLDVGGVINTATSFRCVAKGSYFGTATGVAGAVAPTDANILLYNFNGGNWAGIGSDSNGNMWFRAAGSGAPDARMIIKSANGFVGVLTITPAYPLDVTGDVNCTGAFRVNGTAIVTGAGVTTGGPVGGRVVGTTYTNSNSTPLYLSVTLNVGNAVIGTLTIAGSTVAQGMCVNGGYVNLFGIALPGQTYVASGGAVQAWAEWH